MALVFGLIAASIAAKSSWGQCVTLLPQEQRMLRQTIVSAAPRRHMHYRTVQCDVGDRCEETQHMLKVETAGLNCASAHGWPQ